MVRDQVLPLAFGTAAAGLAILLGLGLLSNLRPVLRNVPVVGTLLQSGSGGGGGPWEGI